MNEIILKINQTYSLLEADKLHSELGILNWILYQVCINKEWSVPCLAKIRMLYGT
jgi:hypothetical protein